MKHGIRRQMATMENGLVFLHTQFIHEQGIHQELTKEYCQILACAINKSITFWRIENNKIVKNYCSSGEAEEMPSLHLLEDKGKVCVLYPKHRALEINPNINISGLEEKYEIYIKSKTELRGIISNNQGARIGFGTEFMSSIPPLPASLLGEISVHSRDIENTIKLGLDWGFTNEMLVNIRSLNSAINRTIHDSREAGSNFSSERNNRVNPGNIDNRGDYEGNRNIFQDREREEFKGAIYTETGALSGHSRAAQEIFQTAPLHEMNPTYGLPPAELVQNRIPQDTPQINHPLTNVNDVLCFSQSKSCDRCRNKFIELLKVPNCAKHLFCRNCFR